MGRTGQHDRFAVVLPGKKQQGSAPHPAGAHLLFSLGRNGHDGSASASPDPLLLAPDPFSLACHMSDTTEPGQLRFYLVAMGATVRLAPP